MKNLIQKIILTGASSLLLVIPILAATTASLSSATVATVPGRIFTVVISVNPNGVKNYAEKIEVRYPADVLEVRSFALAPNWMALTQSGYDVTDNTNGVLIKSAGLPSGLSSQTVFGTITFAAKKAGNGNIQIGTNSIAFEANGQSVITGTGSTVTISASTEILPLTTSVTVSAGGETETSPAVSGEDTSSTESTESTQVSQTAAVAGAGFNWNWLWIPAVLVIAGLVYFFSRKKTV